MRCLLAFALCLVALPTATAGTVAEDAECPSSTGPRRGVLVAGTVCIADPTSGDLEEPAEDLLHRTSDTYQIWSGDDQELYEEDTSQCQEELQAEETGSLNLNGSQVACWNSDPVLLAFVLLTGL